MYDSKASNEFRPGPIRDFIEQYPFATIVGKGKEGWVATQVPLLLHGEDPESWVLEGHLHLRADHSQAWMKFPEVMVLFQGPHAYISNSWYHEKQRAATWNYMTVQWEGTMQFTKAPETLSILKGQVDYFERNQQRPQSLEDLPSDYLEAHIHQIAGIRITMNRVRACFKLSILEPESEFKNIIQKLQDSGKGTDKELAQWMLEYREDKKSTGS